MALAQRPKKDVLDHVFEWTERLVCPTGSGGGGGNRRSAGGGTGYPDEPDEDMLDYVFEHVESFTCRDDRARHHRGGEAHPGTDASLMTRDNSLIEEGPPMETRRPVRLRRQHNNNPQQEGDVIDYVFEHVESFVCSDAKQQSVHLEMDQQPQRQRRGVQRMDQPIPSTILAPSIQGNHTKKNNRRRYYEEEEEVFEGDDEIQLFFRPESRAR